MGTTAIGMEVQLKEIEQGLLDLLAARPESAQSGSAQSSSPILRAKS
jgi:hypothetical protein